MTADPSGPSAPSARSFAESALAVWDELPEALIVLNREWRYEYANPAACALLGLGGAVVGTDSRTVHPDAGATEFGAAYRRVMQTGLPEQAEHHYTPLDTYLRARIRPWPAGGIMIVLTDITDERRPQARLQHNLDLYQQLLDRTAQALTLRDTDGRIVLVNSAAAERIGRPAELIVGRTTDEVFPPEMARRIQAIHQQVLATGEAQDGADVNYLHPDRSVVSEVFPVRDADGAVVGLATSVLDVSQLVATRAELAASELRFRRVWESTTLGIIVAQVDGLILEVNGGLCRMLGHRRERLLEMTPLQLLPPDRWGVARRRQHQAIDAEVGYEVEEDMLRGDGSTMPALMTVTIVDDPIGGGKVLSAVIRDLTDLRQLQDQLLTAERMKAVGRLAAGVVHDANNILAAVSGYAELLGEELDGNELARRHLDGIGRSVQRAGDMVAGLLASTRGQLRRTAVVDLAELVRDLEDMLRQLLPTAVELTLDLEAAPVSVDMSQMQQVVLNLVVNARNAIAGAGTIAIRAGRGARGSVVLSVADDGAGMTEVVARRCLEPFFSTRQDSGGTGLGLSTVHDITRESGGELRVRSTLGAGSTFTLELPAADAPAEPSPAPGPAAVRVLVVDDDPVVRDLMATVLTSAGYSVITASDGVHALAAAADVDLVVSDIEMPQLGGAELAGRLEVDRPGLPVVLVSGAVSAAPGRPVLAKPFTRAALLGAVASALARQP